MKLTICDVCALDGKIARAQWRRKFRTGVAVSLCAAHKAHKLTEDQAFQTVMAAEKRINLIGKEIG